MAEVSTRVQALDPHGRDREVTPTSCPLTCALVLYTPAHMHVCVHTHTEIRINKCNKNNRENPNEPGVVVHTFVIPALGRLEWEDPTFEISLDYT